METKTKTMVSFSPGHLNALPVLFFLRAGLKLELGSGCQREPCRSQRPVLKLCFIIYLPFYPFVGLFMSLKHLVLPVRRRRRRGQEKEKEKEDDEEKELTGSL